MLYAILRPITRIVLQGYYKKIFVNGQHNIPPDAPLILAVNHPSAFTEPCVLATHLERELHFLIRGDIINPKVKWFFDGTNQLPIYRFRDGFSSMRQNEKQFSYCFDLLARSGCIVIFAEGSTKHVKQTRPIQKGAARIAFGAMQNRDLEDVWIVPVGVNFEHSPRPRSKIGVEIGKAISVREYYETYQNDEREGLNLVTKQIYKGLRPLMVHIDDSDRLKSTDDLLLYVSHEESYRDFPVAEYGVSQYFDRQNAVANRINEMGDREWIEIADLVTLYNEKLKSFGVSDVSFPLKNRSVLWWALMTPLALAGWMFLSPAYWLSFYIQKRLNRKDEYISGFRMAGCLVFIPLFIFIWILIFWPVLGWWTLLLPFILPFLSMMAVWWMDALKYMDNGKRWQNLSEDQKEELMKIRTQLMNKLGVNASD